MTELTKEELRERINKLERNLRRLRARRSWKRLKIVHIEQHKLILELKNKRA